MSAGPGAQTASSRHHGGALQSRASIDREKSRGFRPASSRRRVTLSVRNSHWDDGRTKLRVLFDIVLVRSAFWACSWVVATSHPEAWRWCGTGRPASHRGRLWSEGAVVDAQRLAYRSAS